MYFLSVCCQGENLKIVAENMKLSIESPCIWFFTPFPRHHCVTVFVFLYFQQVRYCSLYSFQFVFVFVSNRFGTTWSTARWATGWFSTRWPETWTSDSLQSSSMSSPGFTQDHIFINQHLIQRHDDCLPVIRKVNPHEEGDSEGGEKRQYKYK